MKSFSNHHHASSVFSSANRRIGQRVVATVLAMSCALPITFVTASEGGLRTDEMSAQNAIVDVHSQASTRISSNGVVELSDNETKARQAIQTSFRPIPAEPSLSASLGDRAYSGEPGRSNLEMSESANIDSGFRNAQRTIRDDDASTRVAPTVIPVVSDANICRLKVGYPPVLIRVGTDEFRIAFGVSRVGCDAGCNGYINYDAAWTNEDDSIEYASRSFGFTFPKNAKGTIALDRQVFDSGNTGHTTKSVDVMPREIGCTAAVVSR